MGRNPTNVGLCVKCHRRPQRTRQLCCSCYRYDLLKRTGYRQRRKVRVCQKCHVEMVLYDVRLCLFCHRHTEMSQQEAIAFRRQLTIKQQAAVGSRQLRKPPPTEALPGTTDKISELARRCCAGEELFHGQDERWNLE